MFTDAFVHRFVSNKACFTSDAKPTKVASSVCRAFSTISHLQTEQNLEISNMYPFKTNDTSTLSSQRAFAYWKSISNRQLINISLHDLSVALNDDKDILDDFIFDIYLEWLNIHRLNPSKATLHWQNTLLHWTQSLRAEGFSEGRISREVKLWRSPRRSLGATAERGMPWDDDIVKAFEKELPSKMSSSAGVKRDDKENKPPAREWDICRDAEESERRKLSERMGRDDGKRKKTSRRDFDLSYPPSKHIVCNRCGKQGMSMSTMALM